MHPIMFDTGLCDSLTRQQLPEAQPGLSFLPLSTQTCPRQDLPPEVPPARYCAKITSLFLLTVPTTHTTQRSALALTMLWRKPTSSRQHHTGSRSQPRTAPSGALEAQSAAVPPSQPCGASVPQRPHLTSAFDGHTDTRRVLWGTLHLQDPAQRPRAPCATPHLPVSCSRRRRGCSTRERVRNARPHATLPTCCHLWAKTATRMRAAACTGAESRAPMQYVRSCATVCVCARGACAKLQPRSMRTAAATAAAQGSVPHRPLPLPGSRGIPNAALRGPAVPESLRPRSSCLSARQPPLPPPPRCPP